MALEWLDAIERRANAATPGPWGRNKHGDIGAGQLFTNPVLIHIDGWEECTDADLEFIVAAREDVPRLCRAVRELLTCLREVVNAASDLRFLEELYEDRVEPPRALERAEERYGRALREASKVLERWGRGGA